MLQAIRERLIGWVLWVFIGIICVPFAFFGIESFRGGTGDPVLAKVGGSFGGLFGAERITESELRNAYDRRYRQMQQLMGENFRPERIKPAEFRQAILDDMIQDLTLREYSRDTGYKAPDSVLVETIRNIPAFQENGEFSTRAYQERLGREGYSPARFEAEIRDSLAIDQMRAGIVDTAFATDVELAARYRLVGQERTLAYAVLEAAKYQAAVQPTEDEVKARYEQTKARFLTPERVKIAYVQLSLEQLPKAESPGEPVLKALYEAEKAARFSTAEERRARHILVAFGTDKGAARKKIEEIAARVKGGADFAEIAKTESTDTGSKAAGGELGWVKRGQMVPKFEDALFALESGKISEPVETEFGWHLIKLDELRAATVRPFEDKEVQADLLGVYQRKEAEKHFQQKQERLGELAFEQAASLEPVAKELGLQIKTTDWFGRDSGIDIAGNAAVREAAFSDEVLKNGDNSKPIQLAPGDLVVIRKAEHEAARQKDLAEVAEAIRTDLRQEAAREKMKADGRALQDAVRGGQVADDAAKKAGAQLKSVGAVKRDDAKVEAPILRAAFNLPRPQGNVASLDQVVLPNGDLAVVIVSNVKDGDLQAATPEDAARLRAAERDREAGMEFGALRGHIGDTIRVKRVKPVAEIQDEPVAP